MPNNDTQIARNFHETTKYRLIEQDGEVRFVMGIDPDYRDAMGEQSPSNEPHPFKVYTALESIELPAEFAPFDMPLLEAIALSGAEQELDATPDLAALARVAQLSNGILKRGSHGTGREIFYRAAGGTGARYHLELYYVTGDLPDLPAGIYHYAADTHRLGRVRSGDYRGAVVEASGGEPSVADAPALLVATSTFWRNAWRYKERAYRHTWWDLGTTLANVLAVASAARLRSKVVLGFDDAALNRLLGVDGQREAAVAIVPLGADGATGAGPEVEPVEHAVRPVSNGEYDFPLIWELHAESSLASGAEAAEWRARRARFDSRPASGELPLRPFTSPDLPAMPVDEAIRQRRSTRNYDVDAPISFESFSTLLDRAYRPLAFDCLDPGTRAFVDPYLIVNNVDNLQQGSYAYHPERGALELLAAGDFRQDAARLAADQQYAADAHVNVYSLVDLDAVLAAYGNRGYRLAQLEGALRAQKLHLATHTLGLGAVGSTSIDDAVVDFFAPHAAGKDYMFIVVFGQRRRRARG